ncbi:hypothetical protein L6452_36375 [Arctium lappa]|uniref:Uncharacterized protein n=1 Tax=Arctium lappa TaxID=4217 RepID=A0ACB8Y8F4_ARCLA|nr:hypothetical protein L6452_36375 [Arctium lappa]
MLYHRLPSLLFAHTCGRLEHLLPRRPDDSHAGEEKLGSSHLPDLLQLFQPFGVINKLVMLRAKNQALLQMQDVPSVVNAMQFYANVQPSIRGRNVYVQFSSHQELTTMEQNTQGRGDEVSIINLAAIF